MIGQMNEVEAESITSTIPLQQLLERVKALYDLISQNTYIKDTSYRLKRIIEDASSPATILVIGKERVGKSAVINGLLGREVLSVHSKLSTRVNTFIRYGEKECIRAVFLDGRAATFDIDKMDLLTASDVEVAKILREYIDYVEVIINHELLKNVTFIDSVALEMPTEHAAYFSELLVERADEIFWVIRNGEEATYAELALLEKYNQNRVQPHFIVNAIDHGDPADFVVSEKIRYGDQAGDIYPVSAKMALLAGLTQDDKLLEESGFLELLELIAALSNNKGKKTEHVIERFIHWLGYFYKEIENIKAREPYKSAIDSLRQYAEEEIENSLQQRDLTLLSTYKQECRQLCNVFTSVETLYQLLQKLAGEPYLRDEKIEEFEYFAQHYQQSVRQYRKLHVEYMQAYGLLDTQHRKAFGKGIEKGDPAQYSGHISVMREKRNLDELQTKCEALYNTIKRNETIVLGNLHSIQDHLAELAQNRVLAITSQMEELSGQRKREKKEVKSSFDKILEFSCLKEAQQYIEEAIKPYLLSGALELTGKQQMMMEHSIEKILAVDLSHEGISLSPGQAEELKLQEKFDAGLAVYPLNLTEADVVSDIPEPPVPLHV